MSQVTLHDKLNRLRRKPEPVPEPPPAPASLGRLERSLLGAEAEDGVSLRERLQRLVQVAARRDRSRGVSPVPLAGDDSWPPMEADAFLPDLRDPDTAGLRLPLEELVQGMRVENERGEFFLMENDVHLEAFQGQVPLSRFHSIKPETVGILTAEEGLEHFDLRSAVFLDTETTGLAGGAGTAAFLVGLGYVEGDRFRVRQYFMRDYHEEGALLHALAADLARFERVVTFNGKMFDLPLLDARFRLNRGRFPLRSTPHFDLLHPARRLWKLRLESCRLQSLEVGLLDLRRSGDIPGELIPQVYFDYVRRRDARALKRIFDHNRQDIVSLAALAILACQWVEEGRAEDPRDVVSLARVLERAQLFDRSETEYRRAIECAEGPVRRQALLRLAFRAKRSGDYDVAVALWQEAAAGGAAEACRELAVHHEHRSRDLASALAAIEHGLLLVRAQVEPSERRMAVGFSRRRERVQTKIERLGGAG
jgi:uncharacterized protein YprB with RNaseH-like and TPR domain